MLARDRVGGSLYYSFFLLTFKNKKTQFSFFISD
jgi:hypothetical protein